MPFKPTEWSVVLVGNWNPAILTPVGIAQRLFGLPTGQPIEVLIPLDQIAPFRVLVGDLVVTASMDRLEITAKEPTYECLEHARKVGIRALDELPVTPVSAAGYNLRFASDKPEADALGLFECGIDAAISDEGFVISERAIRRSLAFGEGQINLSIEYKTDGACAILCNFHLGSRAPEQLKVWLSKPISEVEDKAESLLKRVLKANLEVGI